MDRRRWLQYERSQGAPDGCLFGAGPQRREDLAQGMGAFLSSREENGADRCWSDALHLDLFRLAEAPATPSNSTARKQFERSGHRSCNTQLSWGAAPSILQQTTCNHSGFCVIRK